MMMAMLYLDHTYFMDITELQVQPHTLLGLQNPQRDLYNLSVISGLRIGPRLITASTLDSITLFKVIQGD